MGTVHRCLQQGRELGLPHLAAFARLGLAKAALQGGTAPPPAIWRNPQAAGPAAPAPTLEVRLFPCRARWAS